MQHTRDWIDIVAAFAPAVAVLVAVGVALMQYCLQLKQQKQQLFDKRYHIFEVVYNFGAAYLSGDDSPEWRIGALNTKRFEELQHAVRAAPFLFKSSVIAYLQEVNRKALELGKVADELKRWEDESLKRYQEGKPQLPPPHPPSTLAKLNSVFISMMLPETSEVFLPYLRLHHERSLYSRLKTRANDWMQSVDETLNSRYDSLQ